MGRAVRFVRDDNSPLREAAFSHCIKGSLVDADHTEAHRGRVQSKAGYAAQPPGYIAVLCPSSGPVGQDQ